jgi:NAD(P)-dependent dehydrogenase (short-subunit alcohol dehydrogenase family)
MTLEGKVAVVTGAIGLLGKEHCRALREAGAHVVVADLDLAQCKAFASELEVASPKSDAHLLAHAVDVTDKRSLETLRDSILAWKGRIDVLVNNAAINDMFENPTAATELSKFENYPVELFRKSLEVNVTGVFLCSQVLGTVMARAGKGSIINIGSTYGLVGPDQSLYRRPDGEQSFYKSAAYPATKGAVVNFTRFLAAYWGSAGVRVNTLTPGGIENGQDAFFLENYAKKTPLGRMAKRHEMSGALVFLASDDASYVTGANLCVDGGFTAW